MRAPVGSRLGVLSATSGASAEVWGARVGDHADALDEYCEHLLSSDERARIRSYRYPDAADRYIVTRALVRTVLGERLGTAPRDVPVHRTDTGKPIVTGGAHFNVSHSGELVLLAVSADCDIGVDIERRRSLARVEALVQRWLSPREREDVASLVGSGLEPSDAFLRIWSIKEARLKALGVGISGQARAATRLESVEVKPLDALLDGFESTAGDGYVGALAFG